MIGITIQQAIHRLDTLHPNAFTVEEKIRWLSVADGLIYNGIYATHEGTPPAFSGYTHDTPLSTPLLAYEPYDLLYHHYLEGQMLYANGETEGYNNAMSLYNRLVREFWRQYHATHKPLSHRLSVLT